MDLDGALVAPAFVDAHVHHTATGMTLLGLDLRGVPSRQALLDVLAAEARRLRGRPIVGHGWDETLWADPDAAHPGGAGPRHLGLGGLPVAGRRPLGARVQRADRTGARRCARRAASRTPGG